MLLCMALLAPHWRTIRSEFIYTKAPFPSCHASTIVETQSGDLAAAWFGGTHEGAPDVGIYLSRRGRKGWTKPIEVAHPEDGMPCWNPVLFQPSNGPLYLFYKVGPSVRTWHGKVMKSFDSGRTWSASASLPTGFLGPIKDKPISLPDGSILCGSSTEDAGWRVHFERATADLLHWEKTVPLNDPGQVQAIQPTILVRPDGELLALLRTKQRHIYSMKSGDRGVTWSAPRPLELPNPDSGIDAVTLRDHQYLLVYNPSESERTPLQVATSNDGENWAPGPALESEPGEFSYPAVIQTADGLVHIVYTWNRKRIKHVVLDHH